MVSKNSKTSPSGQAAVQRTNSDSARWIIGVLLFCFGLILTAAVLSYFFCWSEDQSALMPAPGANPHEVPQFANLCGGVGARLAELIVGRAFGVFGLLLAVMLVLIGIRIIRQRALLFNHSILSLFFVMILGSLTLGFAFDTNFNLCTSSGWGGMCGIEMAHLLEQYLGGVGTSILLLGGWILTGVFINRNFINTVNTAGNAVVDQGGRIVDLVKQRVAAHTSTEEEQEVEPAEDLPAAPVAPAAAPTPAPVVVASIPMDDAPFSEPYSVEQPSAEPPVEPVMSAVAPPVTMPDEDNPFLEISTLDPLAEPEAKPTPAVGRVVIGPDGMIELDLSDLEAERAAVARSAMVAVPCPSAVAQEEDPDFIVETLPAAGAMTNEEPEEFSEADDLGQPEGLVVHVEEHQPGLVAESDLPMGLYDPLKDLVNYKKPPANLLEKYISASQVSASEIYDNKCRIEETLRNFGIPIQEIKATVGPTVTLYEIVQAQGVKISKIQGLENDIAQSLKAFGIRIIAPIPGKGTIGIEVPNRDKQVVSMYSAICSPEFQRSKAALPVVIGRTIQNENYTFDLTRMPHLLVAGATGQGKSVGLNAIITSLLYTKHPSELKFVMIDPKMVEFSLYAKIEKHFLAKMESEDEAIITDPRKAVYTLNSLCIEMDNRLELCKKAGARNIAEYNEKFVARRLNPEKGHRYLPYIVVVVDEFADLIMTAREVEAPVMRLAQKARAVGIHLIIATQRPDVKVITGGIKANFPARIAFRVMQMIDSRTIIDQPGANQLIGRGDMLLSKDGELIRIQCALVETNEVERIVDYISHQQSYTAPYSLPDYTPDASSDAAAGLGSEEAVAVKYDALFADIAREAVSSGNISTSMIQRNYEVGFNRAGRIMMQLERAGIVGRQQGAKPRDILFHDTLSLEAKLQDLGVF